MQVVSMPWTQPSDRPMPQDDEWRSLRLEWAREHPGHCPLCGLPRDVCFHTSAYLENERNLLRSPNLMVDAQNEAYRRAIRVLTLEELRQLPQPISRRYHRMLMERHQELRNMFPDDRPRPRPRVNPGERTPELRHAWAEAVYGRRDPVPVPVEYPRNVSVAIESQVIYNGPVKLGTTIIERVEVAAPPLAPTCWELLMQDD